MKKVAVINDLSGLGRCSLTAAISVISCLGLEACPLPTAILSNQTEYESFFMDDYTDKMDLIIEEWKKLHIGFEAILTGFLANEQQTYIVEKFIETFKKENTLLVVDPVMGDDGCRYKTCSEKLCSRIKNLAFKGDIITPNITEACILLGKKIDTELPLETAHTYAKELMLKGPSRVVITGLVHKDRIFNIVGENGKTEEISAELTKGSFSGTGDLLSSVLTAGMLKENCTFKEVVETAVRFIEKSAQSASRSNTDPNDGIPFEKYLSVLWSELN